VKIAACVKHVPDTAAVVRVGADGKSLDPQGVTWVLNPYDEYAVEAGLQIKEARGEGEVVAVTYGGAASVESLRKALAMGADRGVRIHREDGAAVDSLVTARALAGALKDGGFDVLLFGMKAVDDEQHQVGTMVAEILGVPSVSNVVELEVGDGTARAKRAVEGGHETVEVSLPAAFTASKGLNEPRYASLKGIMAAKKKPIEEVQPEAAAPAVTVLSMELPPDRPAGKIVGEGADAVPELIRLLREEAKVL
jgi:electron transfer flavoprotein beta subunit